MGNNFNSLYLPAIALAETYLFYPCWSKAAQKGNFTRFFEQLINIDEHLFECVVFLNQQSALQYSRFMDRRHVVLKAYIPHLAIEGSNYGLSLKKGFLTKHHIHGCFPGSARGTLYIENPYFNNNYSRLIPTSNPLLAHNSALQLESC